MARGRRIEKENGRGDIYEEKTIKKKKWERGIEKTRAMKREKEKWKRVRKKMRKVKKRRG